MVSYSWDESFEEQWGDVMIVHGGIGKAMCRGSVCFKPGPQSEQLAAAKQATRSSH